MNEKAPEVAERSSKRNCLWMGRSSEKLARRLGAEMMWPSDGGCRTCKHKGSNQGTVAAAWGRRWRGLSRQEPHALGGRVHGRKYAVCRGAGLQSPWLDAGRSKKLHPTNRRPTWRSTVSYRARLLATVPYRASVAWARCA